MIADRVTGRLVPERDVAALARAIGDVLDARDHGRALGAAARAHVTSQHGWPRVAARMEAAYDAAVSHPR